ncbi:sugar ABC transporter substrate-binding protein [Quadrisphaera sp. DSM 44207]|uniref:ABC transporter substrate-binding protein n=1 Tax=Quadrisphaera sp. DSM 44207 TaxID=1881057 RepID=UPI000891E90F|nr:sugar ABC transporter substrate-binding protein [Quadrisphaera sp. DSM 44207]SDQ05107.1 carbohydrate ABC transporter substrate-binding protein, CUT1 family [Quadrisphaera sp. DSM 44207]
MSNGTHEDPTTPTARSCRSRRGRRGLRASGSALAAAALGLTGCGGPTPAGTGATLDYWLWDSLQLPAYEECIDVFEAEHPDVDVRITQYGWGDYWTKLTAALVAGAGPDVFTNHLTRYPGYVTRDVLLPFGSLEATSDFDGSAFQEGLAELWTGQDGEQYGMPKDFDTVALFYDAGALAEAGMTPEDLQGLTWNPEDGGTFEDVLAHLSVDASGVRGDEPGFDPGSVVTYGLASAGAGGDNHGQTQWSWLAAATGWQYTDAAVWGEEYHYDDPRAQAAIGWYFGLVEKGFMPSFEQVGDAPVPIQQVGSGQAALAADGSWNISAYAALEGVDLGVASIPAGPVGHPVSMYNGLGDSISAQTEQPQAAAELVSFLGSDTCQVIVGEHGVVFPARPAGTQAAIAAFREEGVDVAPFIDLVEAQHVVQFPVTEHPADIAAIMEPALTGMYIGTRDVSALTEVNERINALFQ